MVTMNGPFAIALMIIAFLSVMKWLEWYLFKNGTVQSKRKVRRSENRNPCKEGRKPTVVGKKLKELFFFGKADLKRPPWYTSIPLFLFIVSSSFLYEYFDFQPWQIFICTVFAVIIITLFGIFGLFRANKEFFSAEGRKKRLIRTQIAQLCLAILIMALIFAGLQFQYNKRYIDQPGLKKSVDWVIEPSFEGDWPEFTEGLAPVGLKGKKGFIDKNGNIVIPFQYKDAGNFHDGLAAVQEGRSWGYIDQKGNVIVPFQYDELFEFGDGLAPVKKDGIWSVIDHTGSVKFKTDYNYIYPFREGVAKVEIRDKKYKSLESYNLIDTEGNLLFKNDYELLGNFSEGCIFVWDNEIGKGFFLDINDKKVIEQNFIDASDFSNGVSAVWLESGEYALIDRFGNIIRDLKEEEYNSYLLCHEGLIMFNNGALQESSAGNAIRYGFKDLYGNIIIPANFQHAAFPGEDLIALSVGGFWGFIENPLPEAARRVDPELWASDRTQIATVEGLPVYAGELERYACSIKEKNPKLIGIPALKKAFEQIKSQKAFEKYGEKIDPEMIRYQIGDTYYKKLLLESS